MKVVMAQIEPVYGAAGDAERVSRIIECHPDADLALFPELCLGGYSTGDPSAVALAMDSPEIKVIRSACSANRTAAIVGFTERLDGEGNRFGNSAACIDEDGRLVAVYRKANLFGPAEREAFAPGGELRVIELCGRRFGLMICFDTEFPEPARQLCEAGAEVLVTIAANMRPYEDDHRLATRARALDNRRHHLYVNRVGSEVGHRFVGHSRAVGPDGSVLRELGDLEGVLRIEFDPLLDSDSDTDYLDQVPARLPVKIGDMATGGGDR
jgi:predicted amidohydrolase